MHYFLLNKAKVDYHNEVESIVKKYPSCIILNPSYTLYFKSKRKKDLDNYTFPLHKFLMDTLVEGGIIPDDDCSYIPSFSSRFGGYADSNYAEVQLNGKKSIVPEKEKKIS